MAYTLINDPEERFEQIEAALAQIAESQRSVVRAHERLAEGLIEITRSFNRYMDLSNARMQRIEESIEVLSRAADARLTRIEQNLADLIRAITADHSNEKGRLPS